VLILVQLPFYSDNVTLATFYTFQICTVTLAEKRTEIEIHRSRRKYTKSL